MRPEHQEAIRSRTEMAAKMYVALVINRGFDLSSRSLDQLSGYCAQAALHFDIAEAQIYAHYDDLEHEP